MAWAREWDTDRVTALTSKKNRYKPTMRRGPSARRIFFKPITCPTDDYPIID
jgi:hypothetical protein